MQKGQTPVLILVGIIVMMAVAGGAYYLGGKSTQIVKSYEECLNAPGSKDLTMYPGVCITSDGKRFIQPNTKPITSQPSSTSTIDETANWKIYKENTYNFVVQYPSGWIIKPFDYKKFPVASPDQPQAVVSFVNKAYEGIEFGTPGLIDVGITYIKPKVSFAEFLTQEESVSDKSPNKPVSISDELVNIDGIQSHKVTYKYNDFTNTMVYIPKDKSVYIIRSQVLNKDSSLNTDFFDQILSTFKFTP